MSDAREKYVEAAMFRLRGEMMEHKAIIDAYLESPLAAIKDNDYFTDIVERSKALSVAQNAYMLLQNALTALQAPAPPPQPPAQPVEEVNTEPIKEEELLKKSAAYRKSVKAPPPVKKRGRKKKGEE